MRPSCLCLSATLGAAMIAAGAAHAVPLYELYNNGGPNSSLVDATADQPTYAGFIFKLDQGVNASVDKIGVWVKDATTSNVITELKLFKNENPPPSARQWTQQISVAFMSSSLSSANCSMNGNFCEMQVSGAGTGLTGGTEYLLVASYNNLLSIDPQFANSQNYLNNVPDSNVQFANHVSYVDNYRFLASAGVDTPITPSGLNKGFFGPSLGLNFSSTPEVPAPLPIAGGAIAFSMSRQIRKRIKGVNG